MEISYDYLLQHWELFLLILMRISTFIFVAPVLYGVHCVLAGLSFMLMAMLDVFIGMTFSGGLIDFVLFGLLPAGAGVATHWYWVLVVGVVYFALYFVVFSLNMFFFTK